MNRTGLFHLLDLYKSSPVFEIILPTLIAALGVWVFHAFGWRLSIPMHSSKTRPFQFSLGGLLFVTALVALTIQLKQYQLAPDLSWATIAARLGALTAISVSLPVGLSWLWLRDWPAWQWQLAVKVLVALVAASVLFLASDSIFRAHAPAALTDFVIPWAVGASSLCLPLYVSRRHGFRWVRVTTPSG